MGTYMRFYCICESSQVDIIQYTENRFGEVIKMTSLQPKLTDAYLTELYLHLHFDDFFTKNLCG